MVHGLVVAAAAAVVAVVVDEGKLLLQPRLPAVVVKSVGLLRMDFPPFDEDKTQPIEKQKEVGR